MKQPILNRQITVEVLTDTKDAYGAPTRTWAPLVPVEGSPLVGVKFWAEKQDEMPSRSEAYRNNMAVVSNRARIRMRYRSDITAEMRVVVHGDADEVFQIVGPPAAVGGRKQYLELLVEKYSSAGT